MVFDNTPSALPVNGYALSFNGERTAEYGTQVAFAGSARKLHTATVDMVTSAIRPRHRADPVHPGLNCQRPELN